MGEQCQSWCLKNSKLYLMFVLFVFYNVDKLSFVPFDCAFTTLNYKYYITLDTSLQMFEFENTPISEMQCTAALYLCYSNRNVDDTVKRTSSGVDKIEFVQRYLHTTFSQCKSNVLTTSSQRRFVSWGRCF